MGARTAVRTLTVDPVSLCLRTEGLWRYYQPGEATPPSLLLASLAMALAECGQRLLERGDLDGAEGALAWRAVASRWAFRLRGEPTVAPTEGN